MMDATSCTTTQDAPHQAHLLCLKRLMQRVGLGRRPRILLTAFPL